LREYRLKEWEHFGIISAITIRDGHLRRQVHGTSFFYAFNRRTASSSSTSARRCGPLRVAASSGTANATTGTSDTRWSSRTARQRNAQAEAEIKGGAASPDRAEVFSSRTSSVISARPAEPGGPNRPLYTHRPRSPWRQGKNGSKRSCSTRNGCRAHDVQKTYYPIRRSGSGPPSGPRRLRRLLE